MSDTTHLLWTGGWDSTFRLLQLLFEENRTVQAHYIMRSEQCSGTEIDTMVKIRRHLSRNYPEQRKFLKPLIIVDDISIKPNKKIAAEFEKFKEEKKINEQYQILARYCVQKKISEAELSIIALEKEIINADFFGTFTFPLLDMTKKEMLLIANQNGWMEIMKMTSFCRRPKKGQPCGLCGPCTDVLESGLSFRLPIRSRIVGYIQLPFRRWWRNNYHKQSNRQFQWVKEMLKERY